jgi:glycerophosphoryl diester phosphodiesterase
VDSGGGTPRVVAHRGASEDVAEHTLAAYAKALDDGADGLECDVRLTADGHLVCVHDRTLHRTAGRPGAVSTLELADLSALDFAAWKRGWDLDDEAAEAPDRDATGILTLDRLLALVTSAGRPVEVAIETKHPTRYAGAVERRLVELLRRHGLAHNAGRTVVSARVMSFSTVSLRRVRSLAPSLPRVLLMARVPLRLRDGSLPVGVAAAGPSIAVLRARPHYVERVHRRGHEVHVWTVNDVADLDLCRRLAVDVVITDRPAAAVRRYTSSGS